MKIAVIKLGAKGDVVRTLSILPAIKKQYPDAQISWFTKRNTVDLLHHNPYISEVVGVPLASPPITHFNIVYNLDFDEEACAIASKISAPKKLGFSREGNYPIAYNLGAEYYINTMFDDDLKKNNKKTYQEMIFEAAELPYHHEQGSLVLTEEDKQYAKSFLKNHLLSDKKIIGIHMGASPRWPSKVWSKENMICFIEMATKKGYALLLFGGPDEIEGQRAMAEELRKNGVQIYHNDSRNTDREFVSLVDICSVMICSDSFALHVALALKKKTIGLFFCTAPNEVEGYDLLTKLVSPQLYDFFPERQDQYDETLVKSISAEQVLRAVEDLL